MKILLYAPEYRPNLSNMIRTAEFYGFKEIYIYDKNGLLDPPNNKVSRADMNHMARVWTAGAVEHISINKVDDPLRFISDHNGRSVATVVDPGSITINRFNFEQSDLIVMGPEKEGLPIEFIQKCDQTIHIKGYGNTDCLNVSVAFGVVVHKADSQLRKL